MCGLAIARLHVSVDVFYDMTPVEFKHALKVVNDVSVDLFKTQYEVARYIAYHIWNSAGKSLKGDGYREPKNVGLFYWEAEEKLNEVQSVETIKSRLFAAFGIGKDGKQKTKKKK